MDNTTMNSLHFSLGNKFGDILGTIAQEHLIYNLDPQKALDTFTKTTGMPLDLTLKDREFVCPNCSNKKIEIYMQQIT